MRPGAAEIWFNELDRLAKLYKERCQECQTILARLSKIKVSAKKSDKDKDKELLKEKDGLLKDLQAQGKGLQAGSRASHFFIFSRLPSPPFRRCCTDEMGKSARSCYPPRSSSRTNQSRFSRSQQKTLASQPCTRLVNTRKNARRAVTSSMLAI